MTDTKRAAQLTALQVNICYFIETDLIAPVSGWKLME